MIKEETDWSFNVSVNHQITLKQHWFNFPFTWKCNKWQKSAAFFWSKNETFRENSKINARRAANGSARLQNKSSGRWWQDEEHDWQFMDDSFWGSANGSTWREEKEVERVREREKEDKSKQETSTWKKEITLISAVRRERCISVRTENTQRAFLQVSRMVFIFREIQLEREMQRFIPTAAEWVNKNTTGCWWASAVLSQPNIIIIYNYIYSVWIVWRCPTLFPQLSSCCFRINS